MVLKARAVYHAGQLHLLETVHLEDGQEYEVIIQIGDVEDAMRAALGDLVRWPDPSDNRHEEMEARTDEIDRAFSVGQPVSEMIIEDRGER